MRSVRLLLTVLVPGLLLSSCGHHEDDGREVERSLARVFPGTQVSCPGHVVSSPGGHFTCTVHFGQDSDLDVTVTDGDGGYRITLGGMQVPLASHPSLIKPPCFLRSECGRTDSIRINVLGGGMPSPEFGPPVG